MIETTPFLAIIFTLIITNLLCAAIDVVSHYIRKETQQIIARLIVGVIFSVVTPLILGVWIEFNFPIILAFEHIIQITVLFIGLFYCVYIDLDLFNTGDMMSTIRAIIIGPIIEEVIFRGAFVPFLMHNGCGSIFTFFYCSALFGMAHIHHLFFSKDLSKHNVFRSLVQVGFTTLFGMYSSYVYFSTRLNTIFIIK